MVLGNTDSSRNITISTAGSDSIENILIHEAAHCLDISNSNTYSTGFAKIYASEWENSGLYGATSKEEAFAESFKYFYLDSNFNTSKPNSYAYINDLTK